MVSYTIIINISIIGSNVNINCRQLIDMLDIKKYLRMLYANF